MKAVSRTYWCFAHQTRFFIGCCLGITLSLILMPFLEERCLLHEKNYVREKIALSSENLNQDDINDEYEPVLHLNGKKVIFSEKNLLSRPRYYSTELGIKEKLFIAVLSSSSTVVTFGAALNRTLFKHADKIIFYVEGSDVQKIVDPSVISFSDQRTVLVPFYMLQHIADNYLNDYDYFFFSKDTTHIRGRMLNNFVHHISVSQSVHVGENIEFDSLYCSLDSGILLSNNILRKTVSDLDWCIQHAFSDVDSDNFGRCVLHGTHEPCSSSIQGQKFVSHALMKYNLESSILKSSWSKDLKFAITLYSVSNLEDHYTIHSFFSQHEFMDSEQELLATKDKILSISHLLPNDSSKVTWPVGIEPPFKPRSRLDVINWVYFNETHSFLLNEQTAIVKLKALHKTEIENIIKSALSWVDDQSTDQYIFQRLLNGYKRFDPTRGTEYILDMLFLKDTTGKEVLKRIEVIRPLNHVEIIPVPFVTEHSRVILLLVVRMQEINGAMHFLEEYATNCLEKQDSTVLLLVFLFGPQDLEDTFNILKIRINDLTTKYKSTGAKIAWLSVKTIGKVPPMFSVIDLVSRKLAVDSMLLVCGIGMEIHTEYLNRVRMNTILKTQVFFPIPYVQYHPIIAYKHMALPSNIEVKKDLGHFDNTSYIYFSFYLSDYLNARKQFEYSIPILKSDKDLRNEALYDIKWNVINMFIKSKLHIMRAAEPDLRVKFNFEYCEPEFLSSRYYQCVESMKKNLGSKSQLAAVVLSHIDGDMDDDNDDDDLKH